MNKLEVGKRVFVVSHADGKANPEHYFLDEKGIVNKVADNGHFKIVRFGKDGMIFNTMEHIYLQPNRDGFCYFIAELSNMEQYYEDFELYKVPTKVLKEHMATYKSPW